MSDILENETTRDRLNAIEDVLCEALAAIRELVPDMAGNLASRFEQTAEAAEDLEQDGIARCIRALADDIANR